jgi:hypothetical protein
MREMRYSIDIITRSRHHRYIQNRSIVNSIYLCQCGDDLHFFPEPSIDRLGHYCDIPNQQREEEGRKGEGC